MSQADGPFASPGGSTSLPFPLYRRGKVRDVYDIGSGRLLIVATDRLSAFDVVLPTPVPGKGALLTAISNFWFDRTSQSVPNHRTNEPVDTLGISTEAAAGIADRSTVVRFAERIDIECVVRGHLAGSGWKEYQQQGTLAGETLPTGLRRGDPLPERRFTPAMKNDIGHDENISRERLAAIVGTDVAERLEATSLMLFDAAQDIARQAGFVIADTKFEFGWIDGVLTAIDEVLTPDSSRYWDIETWVDGTEPPSYDKQVVRDWLEGSGWDKEPPGPELPAAIVDTTRQRYATVLNRLAATSKRGNHE
ncbi:MAG TPA: phosphoribosylaminoimidazolesuccinocarboxamide synthase [Thermomicrobiales bacterium]|nr:phosphoribosylaminoimidazolesuccinocarboxamide synthase [Thermomicrobiales bacterium]